MTDTAHPQPMLVTIPGHLFGELPFYDVLDNDDTVVVDLCNRPDLINIRGALQGGLVATLIDVAAGRLAIKYVGEGAGAGTADMSIHFLAPIVEGPARATATFVRAGRRTDSRRGRCDRRRWRATGRPRDAEFRGPDAQGAGSARDSSVARIRNAIQCHRRFAVHHGPTP